MASFQWARASQPRRLCPCSNSSKVTLLAYEVGLRTVLLRCSTCRISSASLTSWPLMTPTRSQRTFSALPLFSASSVSCLRTHSSLVNRSPFAGPVWALLVLEDGPSGFPYVGDVSGHPHPQPRPDAVRDLDLRSLKIPTLMGSVLDPLSSDEVPGRPPSEVPPSSFPMQICFCFPYLTPLNASSSTLKVTNN